LEVHEVPGDLRALAITNTGLGNTSWAVELGGRVLVVDPERDPAPYQRAAARLGGPIALVAETHLHADFVTGSPELGATGSEVLAPAGAKSEWPHRAMADEEVAELDGWRLEAVATPGHTPEHLSYLLSDGDRPRAVFSGGSLLVGAVARTDLIDPADTEGLTRALWHSINHRLLSLPDDVAVFPTHGAGSFCTASGEAKRWTTIGAERRDNPLLQASDEDEFVRRVLDGFGSYPTYFGRLRALNRRGPRVFGVFPMLPKLTADDVSDLRERGATVIDTRSVADYAEGHVAGSLSITLRPQFCSWLGWIVPDPSAPLVFITDTHTDRAELVRQCLNIGYESLAGEIDLESWEAAGGDVARTHLVRPGEAVDRVVLDVRQDNEWDEGHVPGARHVELGALAARPGAAGDGPVMTMCGHGERAATAASLLEAGGHSDVAIFQGGPEDWARTAGDDLDQD